MYLSYPASALRFRPPAPTCPVHPSIPSSCNQPFLPSRARRGANISPDLSRFRTLPVATGVAPLYTEPRRERCWRRVQLSTFRPSLCTLCFHILTNCFSRKPFILITIPIAPGAKSRIPPAFLCARRLPRPCRGVSVANPFLSYSCRLFVVSKKVICPGISNFQTLFAKHPGGGTFCTVSAEFQAVRRGHHGILLAESGSGMPNR